MSKEILLTKETILTFVSKYNLGGLVESVIWDIEDSTLKTNFLLSDKSLKGEVLLKKFEVDDAKFGIYETTQLNRMLGVIEDQCYLNLIKVGDKWRTLEIKDSTTKIKFMLAELDVIENPGKTKYIPDFDLSIKLTPRLIDKILKTKSAIEGAKYFKINSDILSNECKIVIGSGYNKVIIDVECEDELEDIQDLTFSLEHFTKILSVNKKFDTNKFQVSKEGLVSLDFEDKNFKMNYLMVAQLGVGDD